MIQAVRHWVEVGNAWLRSVDRPEVDIDALEISFDLEGPVAGEAVMPRNVARRRRSELRLRINEDLMRRYPVRMVQITAPHEVAHFVTHLGWERPRAHGKEWGWVMEELFAKPADPTHTMQVAPKPTASFAYFCGCQGEHTHFVAPDIHEAIASGRARYRCSACSEEIWGGVYLASPLPT